MTPEEAKKIAREIADWAIAEELTPIKERLEKMIVEALQESAQEERKVRAKRIENKFLLSVQDVKDGIYCLYRGENG